MVKRRSNINNVVERIAKMFKRRKTEVNILKEGGGNIIPRRTRATTGNKTNASLKKEQNDRRRIELKKEKRKRIVELMELMNILANRLKNINLQIERLNSGRVNPFNK